MESEGANKFRKRKKVKQKQNKKRKKNTSWMNQKKSHFAIFKR